MKTVNLKNIKSEFEKLKAKIVGRFDKIQDFNT